MAEDDYASVNRNAKKPNVNENAKKPKYERKLNDAECEVLISEVQLRPCLWNDCHTDFKNTLVTRKLWTEIGSSLNLSGEETKKKWKNLKDTFRKHMQKPPYKSGSVAGAPQCKWKFFELMQFTRDVLQRYSSQEMTRDAQSLTQSEMGEDDTFDDENNLENFPQLEELYPVESNLQLDMPQSTSEPDTVRSTTSAFRVGMNGFVRPYRSKANLIKRNEIDKKMIDLEVRKINAILGMQRQNDKGDDYHFLISLLPFIQGLEPMEKLQLRSKILNCVMEAYSKHESKKRNQNYFWHDSREFNDHQSSSSDTNLSAAEFSNESHDTTEQT